MSHDSRLPIRLALGAALLATGAVTGSLATWSLVPPRACTSCAQVQVQVSAPSPASCVEDSPAEEGEVVQLAQLAPGGAARPAREHAGLRLTRRPAARRP